MYGLMVASGKNFLQKWHKRWDEVEAYYFTQVRPKRSFDLIVKLN